VRVTFIGVFPTVATTRVLVSLLSAITSVAAAVAKNETTLTIKRTHFFGFGCKPVHPNSSFSSFCKPMLTEDKRDWDRRDERCNDDGRPAQGRPYI
jgi:hypothetical protein